MRGRAAAGGWPALGRPDGGGQAAALSQTLPGLLADQAQTRPRAVAIRHKDLGIWRETTWGEFLDHVGGLAAALAGAGLRAGDRALIVADNQPEWLYADLAIQACGAYSVGAYPSQMAAEVAFIIAHSQARIAFCGDQEQVDKILQHRPQLPALERLVVFDMKGVGAYRDSMIESFQGFEAHGRQILEANPALFRGLLAERRGEDVAVIGYTSGTTGKPKGAMVRHSNLISMAAALVARTRLGPRDRIFSHFPLCHPAVRVIDACTSLVSGCSVNFPESAEAVVEDMVELAPTLMLGTPRVYERLMADVNIRAERGDRFKHGCYNLAVGVLRSRLERRLNRRPALYDPILGLAGHWLAGRQVLNQLGLGKLRFGSCGGASTSAELLKFFWAFGVPIFETYGQSETSGIAFAQRDFTDTGSSGTALEGVEARISPEGELQLRGPGIFAGYLGDEERTSAAFLDGWYCTGDIARLDPEGRLVMMDRESHVMHMADGLELSPSEIENKLKLSPYISDAMALGPGRPKVTALIQIELQTVADWALHQNLAYTTFRSLAENPRVVELIRAEVERANRLLAGDRQVMDFRLLPRELDPDDDEVTPTRKIKREVVARRFGDLIDSLYAVVAQETR